MKKLYMWILWSLLLVAVNVYTIPWAMWPTFAVTNEYKYVWYEYAIAFFILILFNTGIIQTFLAIKSNRVPFVWYGIAILAVQLVCIMYPFTALDLVLPVMFSLILFIVQLVKR